MTGAPPYNAQSPTQQPRYPAYSSPNKNPYYPNNEQPQPYHQHPPQTPPAFAPSSVARSPHFSHASPMPSTLPPPLNGAAPHPSHPEPSPYQGHSAGSQLPPLTRPYSSSVMAGNGGSPYGSATPHGHPNHPEGHSQSPTRESQSPYRMRGNGAGYGPSILREPRPASPQETVGTIPDSPTGPSFTDLSFSFRSLPEPPILCLSPVFSRVRRMNSPRESRPLRRPPSPPTRRTLPLPLNTGN